MNKAEKAKKAMKNSLNCYQSVLSTFSPEYDISEERAIQIGELFGGGIMHEGSFCGAVTGALSVIGLHFTDPNRNNKKDVELIGKQFLERFREQNESYLCRELLKYDISTDDSLQKAYDNNAFNNCPQFVYSAVDILETLLNTKKG